jgi:hypothetical protein
LQAVSVNCTYIELMVSCVHDDIDVTLTPPPALVVTSRLQVPWSLPPTFKDKVYVCEIVDAEFPGYVYLLLVDRLSKQMNANTYEFTMSTDTDEYLHQVHSQLDAFMANGTDCGLYGPAITQQSEAMFANDARVIDAVLSVRCTAWPTQAADWSERHKNRNWPDTPTIDCVVNKGCDVVEVAQHQCRRDE